MPNALTHSETCACHRAELLLFTHPDGHRTLEMRFRDETEDMWTERIASKYAKARGERRPGR